MDRTLVALAAALALAGCYLGPIDDGSYHSHRGPAACGDGVCEAAEDCWGCAEDCGACSAGWDVDLGSGAVDVSGSTRDRLDAYGSGCGDGGSGPDIAYRWFAPVSGTYTVWLYSASFDALLAVRADTSSGRELACVDLATGADAVSLWLGAGQAIVVIVDGAGRDSGSFRLSIAASAPAAWCGDGACSGGESCGTCPGDCGRCAPAAWCGDGACSGGESCGTCPGDCGRCSVCGDGLCDALEDSWSCPADCGDLSACGDGFCDAVEDGWICPEDCDVCQGTCGDGFCGGGEDGWSCRADCAAGCGDGVCDYTEDGLSCPTDCTGYCGDAVCDPAEGGGTCAADCSFLCGDGYCDYGEDEWSCSWDCGVLCPG